MTTRALAVVLKINRPIDLTNDSFNPAKSWFVHIPVLFPCGRSEILPLLCLPELPDQPKATNTRLPWMLYRHQLGKCNYTIIVFFSFLFDKSKQNYVQRRKCGVNSKINFKLFQVTIYIFIFGILALEIIETLSLLNGLILQFVNVFVRVLH